MQIDQVVDTPCDTDKIWDKYCCLCRMHNRYALFKNKLTFREVKLTTKVVCFSASESLNANLCLHQPQQCIGILKESHCI